MNAGRPRAIVAAVATLGILAAACTASTPATAPQRTTTTSAVPAAVATAAATEEPIELVGKFDVSPVRGVWGTNVTAVASGLRSNASYDLKWTSVVGSWKLSPDKAEYKGRDYAPVRTTLKTVTTDIAGRFATTIVAPQDFGFQHDILVVDSGGQVIRNKAGFDIDLDVSISPKSGPVGTPITIEARGVGWRQLENSWLVSYDNQFTGWLSAVTTKGLARAVIPAAGTPGTHVVTILHGDFTFPYLNMQQSPEPDRPMFRIPFMVTDGPAVLPADVTKQSLPILAAKPVDKGIWTSPASGLVGDQVTLLGKGLPSRSELSLTWPTMQGNRVATGYEQVTKDFGKVSVDGNGAFSWTFTVPNDLGGAHHIVARMGTTVIAETDFLVQPRIFSLTPSHGPSGTKAQIRLQGVGWTETANIYNLTYDNGYAGYACGFNSGGDVQVDFVVSGQKGWHFIDLYPGIYKGTETRPVNYRVPQLTFAADHPAETLPAFHLAFFID